MAAHRYLEHFSRPESFGKEKSVKRDFPSYGIRTQCAVVSCNVSFKREIDEATFVNILAGKIPVGEREPHMMTFFMEQFPDVIRDVMRENNLTLKQLATIFETFPKVFQGGSFKQLKQAMLDE